MFEARAKYKAAQGQGQECRRLRPRLRTFEARAKDKEALGQGQERLMPNPRKLEEKAKASFFRG